MKTSEKYFGVVVGP